MAETEVSTGQAPADSSGTTAKAPGANGGQSVSSSQTTGNGPDAGAMESFFDPQSIADKPELMAAYKQMQSSYTRKMQGVSKHQPKIDAYERFERDPIGTLQQLATQYGYQFVQRGQDQPVEQEFKSWDDVQNHFFKQFRDKEMRPLMNEVRELKKQNVEGHLDSHYPDWRTYETEMMDTLKAHPSLVADPDKLYLLSVPAEVREAKATKAAMQKIKSASENAQVSGGGTTTKQTTQAPTGPLTFNQAVEVAKQRLASKGLTRPAG